MHALDLETHLIQPGLLAPPIVCGSLATEEPGSERILDVSEVRAEFPEVIGRAELVVGANIAFDFATLAADNPDLIDLIFTCYAEDRVFDVLIAPALDAIARGHLFMDPRSGGKLRDPDTGKPKDRYSLSIVSDLVLGRVTAKVNDFWRLRYAILGDVPIGDWPEVARQYPKDDARNTLDVAVEIIRRVRAGEWYNLHNLPDQARAAWAMHLACTWGVRTDPARVAKLQAKVDKAHEVAIEKFKGAGFIRANGTGDKAAQKRATAIAYGAEGKCKRCGGTGKVKSEKTGKPVTCKAADASDVEVEASAGEEVPRVECPSCEDGRGPDGLPCERCDGTGEVPDYVIANGCDGTGLDLNTAPGLPRTAKGAISTSRDSLAESGDELLEEFGNVSETEKIRNTYLPVLREGVERPINFAANVLVASGRTSYAGIIQLVPRGGGIRWCFIPRVGWVYCSIDYSAIELCTLAQSQLWIVGSSRMAELINETGDPGFLHTSFAAKMVGVDALELKGRIDAGDNQAIGFRYAAKAANFGFPGGMGASTLVLAKRKRIEGETKSPDGEVTYPGIRFCILIGGEHRCGTEKVTEWKKKLIPPTCKRCLECAEDLRAAWFQQWPEMKPYFDHVSREVDAGGQVVQFVSERVRGGLDFCNAANTYFQGLAADGAKRALWNVSRECYTDRASPMFGSRPLFFNHDEIFSEIPEHLAHEAAHRMTDVMIASMREFVPDVKVSAEPALMRRWDKNAKAIYDASGRLIPWEPKIKCSKCGETSKGYELTCPKCGTFTELEK